MKLREFGSYKEFPKEKFHDFKEFIDKSWNDRFNLYDDSYIYKEQMPQKQQFFNYEGNSLKAKNYIGFISYNGENITVYPKIFDNDIEDKDIDKYLMANLLYWIKRSKRIRIPIINSDMDLEKTNSFLEFLINIFSKYTYNLIYNKPYNCYEEIEEEVQYLKGRLNVNRYLKENISTGRWNSFNTVHEPFIYNNKFNQIIKFVVSKLLKSTENSESREYLTKITFILDEVDDVHCTEYDCREVRLNRLQEDYRLVLTFCEMFLKNTSISKSSDDGRLNFCFLIPMEILFEDFIFDFIKDKFKDDYMEITSQKSNLFLADVSIDGEKPKRIFNLRQDIYFKKLDNEVVILDTKYKVLENNESKKFGISQSDMYQMCSYALRGGYKKLALVYPASGRFNKDLKFTIRSPFTEEEISISVIIVSFGLNYNDYVSGMNNRTLLESNDTKLYSELKNILTIQKS